MRYIGERRKKQIVTAMAYITFQLTKKLFINNITKKVFCIENIPTFRQVKINHETNNLIPLL